MVAAAPNTEIIERPPDRQQDLALAHMPVMDVARMIERANAIGEIVKTLMKEGLHYGQVPGTDKPTLLKAGAEMLCTLFGLSKRFEVTTCVEDWDGKAHNGEPFFYYVYRSRLYRGDMLVAEADGSANSRESKYRWRWVKGDDVPPGMSKERLQKRSGVTTEFAFAVEIAETSGPYGKKPEYWKRFQDAIAAGTARKVKRQTKTTKEMDAWEIGDELYRVPNDDIASQVNTLQKMAQKRALVAATLLAVNASEYFTQDVEDFEPLEVPATVVVTAAPAASADQAPTQGTANQAIANARAELMAAMKGYATANANGKAGAGRAAALEIMKRVAGVDRVGAVPADKIASVLAELRKPEQTYAPKDETKEPWEKWVGRYMEACQDMGAGPAQSDKGLAKALAGIGITDAGHAESTTAEWRASILTAVNDGQFDFDTGEILA